MRLFGLLHLLGQASLRMEQTLWPEDYERMTREVERAVTTNNVMRSLFMTASFSIVIGSVALITPDPRAITCSDGWFDCFDTG